MLKTGVPVYEEGGTRIVPFVHGGLAEVFAPLYDSLDGIDYQAMYKILSIANRGDRLNKTGKLVPLTEKEYLNKFDVCCAASSVAIDKINIQQIADFILDIDKKDNVVDLFKIIKK